MERFDAEYWTTATPDDELVIPEPAIEEKGQDLPAAMTGEAPQLPSATRGVRVDRESVEKLDVAGIAEVLDEARRSPLANRWTVDVEFNSYDGDLRGLWEIPEAVAFCRVIPAELPDWPWYFGLPTRPLQKAAVSFSPLWDVSGSTPPHGPEWKQMVRQVIGGFNAGICHANRCRTHFCAGVGLLNA